MEQISTYRLVTDFNKSEMRNRMVPQEVVAGWPCIRQIGKTLCLTIPYYRRQVGRGKTALYPLYCSVTFPVKNPGRLLDFTIYPLQREWTNLDYSKPVGYFRHEALKDVTTREEYDGLCQKLYGYYDRMIEAVLEKRPFEEEGEMRELFSELMEPGQYPAYLKINKKFYSWFCRL